MIFRSYSQRKAFNATGIERCVRYLVEDVTLQAGGRSHLNQRIIEEVSDDQEQMGMMLEYISFPSEASDLTWRDLITVIKTVGAFALWYEKKGFTFRYKVMEAGLMVVQGSLSGMRSRPAVTE